MKVKKRDGTLVPVRLDEITDRIASLSKDLDQVVIDPVKITLEVVEKIHDGISTSVIDSFTAGICHGKTIEHPHFNVLASRLIISDHHKNVMLNAKMKYSEVCKILYTNTDQLDEPSPLISDELYYMSQTYKDLIDSMIDDDRDFQIDYFGFKTLSKSYLLKVAGTSIETPQHMWMRTALGIWGKVKTTDGTVYQENFDLIKETYDLLSNKYFTHATPTLFNAGTRIPQLFSCFEENTLVDTLDGPKSIKDINIGDQVITHLGNVKKVLQIHKNPLGDRDVYDLKIRKTTPLKVTGNHKLWTWNKNSNVVEWKAVEELNLGDYIGIPKYNGSVVETQIDVKKEIEQIYNKLKGGFDDRENIQDTIVINEKDNTIGITTSWISNHLNNGEEILMTKTNNSIKKIIKIDEVFCRFLGIWYGDGHICRRTTKTGIKVNTGIGITTSKDNIQMIEFCTSMKEYFGIEPTFHDLKEQNTTNIFFNSKILGTLFEHLYGKGFAGKSLHKDIFKYSTELVIAFIEGLISSDGCVSKEGAISLCMANENLINQIYTLCRLHNFDITAPKKATIGKLTKHQAYLLNLTSMRYVLKNIYKTYTDDRLEKMANKTHIRNQYSSIELNGFKFLPFESKQKITIKSNYVYTLGVEDDHSYSIGGIIAQNCFLNGMDDSLESMYQTLANIAQISKGAGGVGFRVSDIRCKGAYIRGTGGRSHGIVPLLRVFDATARHVDQCFVKETIVPTTHGLKRFDELVIGDEIITDKGTTERISKIFRTNNDDSKLYGITIKHSIEPTWVTGAHPILCLPDQAKGLNYSEIVNRLEKKIIEPEFVEVKDLKIDDFIGFPIPKFVKDISEYTNDDCRFYGVMLGDGHISKDGDQAYICGNPETDDFAFYSNYLLSSGCKITESLRNDNYKRLVFTPQTASMFKFGRVHLYDSNSEKCVHQSFLHLPIDKALQIVYGILETDGHVGKDDKSTEIVLEMTSKNVIDSVKYILLRAGVLTSGAIVDRIGESHETDRGIITTQKLAYRLRIPKLQVICDLMNLKYCSGKTTQFRYQDLIFSRIKRIESKLYKGPVYDLETSGPEHTYLTQLGSVHNGGGKRSGSFAVYLEPWHADVEDFLKCKLAHGDENMKARDLFYALWIPDLFMERVKANESWSLMCPSECPGLTKVYGKEFKKLYEKYEAEGRVVRTVKAQDLWHAILTSQIETGSPYMLYKDAANNKSNQKNVGVLGNSNLCAEIMEYSDSQKYACCVLASIVLPTYVKEDEGGIKVFDHQKLYDVVKVVTRNLNRVIDINYYPVPETRVSNMSERPIGIGIQGLADVFFKMQMPYDSEEALKLDKEISETIYYAAMTASMELSKKDGPYATYKGSPISKGQFQFDLWKEFPTTPEVPSKVVPTVHSGRWDWEKLRKDIKKHGVRNSLVTAYMPTASTSQIMGSVAEAFEPVTNNCFTRKVKAGEFILLNHYMANELIKLGLWKEDMRNILLDSRGSIQNIEGIPARIKEIYKTVWEIKQSILIKHSITRGIYVDQSQSLNLYFASGDAELITKAHFYGWSGGLKTGSYYIRTKPAADAASFTKEEKEEPISSPTSTKSSPTKRSPLKTKDTDSGGVGPPECDGCG